MASPDPGFEMSPALVRSPEVDPANRAEGNADVPRQLQGRGPRQDDEVCPAEGRLEPGDEGPEEGEGRADVHCVVTVTRDCCPPTVHLSLPHRCSDWSSGKSVISGKLGQ